MLQELIVFFRKGLAQGVGLAGTALVAATVTGIIHIFSPGQAISSSQVNENFASLKTAIESINTTDGYSTAETATSKTWIDGKTV